MSRAALLTPHAAEHEASLSRRMEKGRMPQGIVPLVRWYIEAISDELPERLHRAELWHDMVTTHERENGIRPVGGSLIGSLAWAGDMRRILEGSPSQTDEDGYYVTPVRAALSRLSRRHPFMARNLAALAMREGDWQAMAAAKGWEEEEMSVYLAEALRRLWMEHHERTTKGMVA